MKLNWPESTYLVNHNYNFLYCPIPKNACTLFKCLTLELHDESKIIDPDIYRKHIHRYLGKNPSKIKLTSYKYQEAMSILKSEDFFKFVILRDPFKRLASAYLDKFVKRHSAYINFVLDVISKVYNSLSLPANPKKSITFRQFINYLYVTEDDMLNNHWKPQHLFLGNTSFDYIGQFENMNKVLEDISDRLKIQLDKSSSKNKLTYNVNDNERGFQDFYASDLKKQGIMPHIDNLYTPDLMDMVRERFSKDISLYQDIFNISIG